MKGTEEDWKKLGQKVRTLRKTLEPIHQAIGLTNWWDGVGSIKYQDRSNQVLASIFTLDLIVSLALIIIFSYISRHQCP